VLVALVFFVVDTSALTATSDAAFGHDLMHENFRTKASGNEPALLYSVVDFLMLILTCSIFFLFLLL
jgi:hypothetical protein